MHSFPTGSPTQGCNVVWTSQGIQLAGRKTTIISRVLIGVLRVSVSPQLCRDSFVLFPNRIGQPIGARGCGNRKASKLQSKDHDYPTFVDRCFEGCRFIMLVSSGLFPCTSGLAVRAGSPTQVTKGVCTSQGIQVAGRKTTIVPRLSIGALRVPVSTQLCRD